jgi:hypothetical protein
MTPGEQRIVDLNARLTYKPGHKLSIAINLGREFYTGVLTFYAPDADGIKDQVLTCHKERIGLKVDVDKMTDREICVKLREFITISEAHEIAEWIRVDGVTLINPHGKNT